MSNGIYDNSLILDEVKNNIDIGSYNEFNKAINELKNDIKDLKLNQIRFIEENNYLIKRNFILENENKRLKIKNIELNEENKKIKSSKLWKFKNKFF